MRAWYHTSSGFSADLCQMLHSESTRLTVRKNGRQVVRTVYPSWAAAIAVLKEHDSGWISDLTGMPLQ